MERHWPYNILDDYNFCSDDGTGPTGRCRKHNGDDICDGEVYSAQVMLRFKNVFMDPPSPGAMPCESRASSEALK